MLFQIAGIGDSDQGRQFGDGARTRWPQYGAVMITGEQHAVGMGEKLIFARQAQRFPPQVVQNGFGRRQVDPQPQLPVARGGVCAGQGDQQVGVGKQHLAQRGAVGKRIVLMARQARQVQVHLRGLLV